MLDRGKLAQDIARIAENLFPELKDEREIAKKVWDDISQDGGFQMRVEASGCSFLVPRWRGNISDVFDVDCNLDNYTAISVDGSQIYPDRHVSGASCFLVNTGGAILSYGQESAARFFSEPTVLLAQDVVGNRDISFSRDLVDLKREEFELRKMLEVAVEWVRTPSTCFVDGTIIFWQLEGKPLAIKEQFLNEYLRIFEQFYQNKILIGGYISMPKSRELVNLVKLGLCRFTNADCIACHKQYDTFPCKQVDHVLDTHMAKVMLKEKQRTTVFYSTSKIVDWYPEHLQPAFVYFNVGSEIVRIEIPSWIAEDDVLLNRMCAVSYDQSKKGRGYPVCLAEAHEQAVVKGGDREFFYHLLQKISLEKNRRLSFSPKSIKKRGIGI